jgi:histidine ammonia-lyase
VDHATHCLAIELMVACQALDLRLPGKSGRGAWAAHQLIRAKVPTLDTDRELHKDIAAVRQLIDSGELVAAVRGACYENGP